NSYCLQLKLTEYLDLPHIKLSFIYKLLLYDINIVHLAMILAFLQKNKPIMKYYFINRFFHVYKFGSLYYWMEVNGMEIKPIMSTTSGSHNGLGFRDNGLGFRDKKRERERERDEEKRINEGYIVFRRCMYLLTSIVFKKYQAVHIYLTSYHRTLHYIL
ncbi:hypothetical protein ACJX0J_017764, partial [Zea mays]